MKIAVSIAVHEQVDVILNQIDNTKKFNPGNNFSFFLHCSADSPESFFRALKSIESDAVIVGDVRHHTSCPIQKTKNLSLAHFGNFANAAKQQFDVFTIQNSNDMFVRSGVDFSGVGCPTCRASAGDFRQAQCIQDPLCKALFDYVKVDLAYGGLLEGTWFPFELFKKVAEAHAAFPVGDKEECVIPTIFFGLYPELASEAKRGHTFVKSEIFKEDVNNVRAGDPPWAYSVKRVTRNMSDPIRSYINSL